MQTPTTNNISNQHSKRLKPMKLSFAHNKSKEQTAQNNHHTASEHLNQQTKESTRWNATIALDSSSIKSSSTPKIKGETEHGSTSVPTAC